ncbi:MAG: hypothetical protein Q9169_008331, partial [Polycauliona sp. 2 TL-2023]
PTAQSSKCTETIPPSGPKPKPPIPLPNPGPAPVQPGLSLPQDFPPLAAPQPAPVPPPRSQKKTTVPSTPASVIDPTIPLSQLAKGSSATSAKGKARESSVVKDDVPVQPVLDNSLGTVPKPRSKKETSSSVSVAQPQEQRDGKSREQSAAADGPGAGSSKEPDEAIGQRQKASTKRHPGILDLDTIQTASAEKPSQIKGQAVESIPASSTSTSTFSQPPTPATGVSQISGAATGTAPQSRTLRVLPASIVASKGEGSRKGPVTTVSKENVTATSTQGPSRRGSLSSMNPPGTPASERISDNVSITSTSMSRANSPPLGKLGTGTTRHVSKSQQKKERQARAKQAEEAAKLEETPTKAPIEEPVQAPIIGRKKKQKKPAKEGTSGTADSTPAVTRPGSPVPHEATVVGREETTPNTPTRATKSDGAKATMEPEAETAHASPVHPAIDAGQEQQQQQSEISAASLFASLAESGEISTTALDNIFKPVIGLNHRFDTDMALLEHMPEVGTLPELTDAQVKLLDQGEAVCVDQPADHQRVIVLPDRRTLRNLTAEQAERYIQLRKRALLTSEKLFEMDHGPAPPRSHTSTSTADRENERPHLPNPFLTESQTASTSSPSSGTTFPQAFGSITGTNPTTYVDQAAAFITTKRSAMAGAGGSGMMSVEEAERNMIASRRETEVLEKKLNALVKRNRRLIVG